MAKDKKAEKVEKDKKVEVPEDHHPHGEWDVCNDPSINKPKE